MSIKKIFKCFNRSVKSNSEKYNSSPAKLRKRGMYRSFSFFKGEKKSHIIPTK